MDKEKFVEKFNEVETKLTLSNIENTIIRIKENSKKSVDADSHYDDFPYGHQKLINCMEELAELTQELSKKLRGIDDKMNLIQELADVTTCIFLIKHICDISDEDLLKGIIVKLDRMDEVISKYSYYQ